MLSRSVAFWIQADCEQYAMRSEPHVTSPDTRRISPIAPSISDDFPEPTGPTIAHSSPRLISRLRGDIEKVFGGSAFSSCFGALGLLSSGLASCLLAFLEKKRRFFSSLGALLLRRRKAHIFFCFCFCFFCCFFSCAAVGLSVASSVTSSHSKSALVNLRPYGDDSSALTDTSCCSA